MSELGEFGTTLLIQPSLKVALEIFVATISAKSLHTRFELMRQDKYYWLIMHGYRDTPVGRCIVEFYDLAFMFRLVRSAVGSQWHPPSTHLQCDSLPEGIAAREISTGGIRFSSTMTAIAIPEALMALPMGQYCSSAATEKKPQC